MGELRAGKDRKELRATYYVRAQMHPQSYGDVINCTAMMDMLESVWSLPTYFVHTKLFNPNWLRKMMVGLHGGVSISYLFHTSLTG
jgi:hypothetical protein